MFGAGLGWAGLGGSKLLGPQLGLLFWLSWYKLDTGDRARLLVIDHLVQVFWLSGHVACASFLSSMNETVGAGEP